MEQHDSVIWAIKDIGGISKARIERSGLLSEWLQLPGTVRSQVFRNDSTQDADEVAAQLVQMGFPHLDTGDKLLCWLLDPNKRDLNRTDASLVDHLEEENRKLREEIEELRSRLEKYEGEKEPPEKVNKSHETIFIQHGKNFIPVHVPIAEEVPF